VDHSSGMSLRRVLVIEVEAVRLDMATGYVGALRISGNEVPKGVVCAGALENRWRGWILSQVAREASGSALPASVFARPLIGILAAASAHDTFWGLHFAERKHPHDPVAMSKRRLTSITSTRRSSFEEVVTIFFAETEHVIFARPTWRGSRIRLHSRRVGPSKRRLRRPAEPALLASAGVDLAGTIGESADAHGPRRHGIH